MILSPIKDGNGLTREEIKTIAAKKAAQSLCVYRVSAIGLNKHGEIVGTSINKHRFPKKGGSIHAEMALMRAHGKALKTIVICRVGKGGDIHPIHPCSVCAEKARELGIKILSVEA